MKHASVSTVVLSLLMAVSGCGGGSSSSPDTGASTSDGVDLPKAPVVITEANSVEVAVMALQSDVSEINDPSASATSASLGVRVVKAAKKSSLAAKEKAQETLVCDSGSVTVTVDDANDSGAFDRGDTLTAEYDNCLEDFDDFKVLTSGSNSIKLHTGKLLSSNYDATYTFEDFTEVTGSDYFRADGVMRDTAVYNYDSGVSVRSHSVVAESLVIEDDDRAMFVEDLALELANHSDTGINSLNYNTWMSRTELGGSVTIETTNLFEVVGDGYFTSGSMRVSGANGSYVLIDANTGDDETVYLTVFDGSTSTSQELTWEALYASESNAVATGGEMPTARFSHVRMDSLH